MSASPVTNVYKCLGFSVADVAELADALDSKSGTRKGVWVRPPPSAPPGNKGETAVLANKHSGFIVIANFS